MGERRPAGKTRPSPSAAWKWVNVRRTGVREESGGQGRRRECLIQKRARPAAARGAIPGSEDRAPPPGAAGRQPPQPSHPAPPPSPFIKTFPSGLRPDTVPELLSLLAPSYQSGPNSEGTPALPGRPARLVEGHGALRGGRVGSWSPGCGSIPRRGVQGVLPSH